LTSGREQQEIAAPASTHPARPVRCRATIEIHAVKRSRKLDMQPTEEILRHWREAVPDDRLAHLVKDAMRALLRALAMRLARHSVSLGHWTFLRILWEQSGLTQRELSAQAGVMEPTTHAALSAMEKRGYITRRRRPDNKRNVLVFLTPKGRLLKSRLVPLAEDVNAVAIRGVRGVDVATTRRTLLAIIENLARDEMEAADKQRRIPSTRELGRLVADAPLRGRSLRRMG